MHEVPSVGETQHPRAQRVADHVALIGVTLVLGVLVAAFILHEQDSGRRHDQQVAAQHNALSVIRRSVADVLDRETVLAGIVGAGPRPSAATWPWLATVVTSQRLASGADFIERVPERARRAWERRTGLRIVEGTARGGLREANRRPVHLVLSQGLRAAPGALRRGLDLAADPLRRALLLRAARSGRPVATPPVDFLASTPRQRGVIVFAAARSARGRLKGWVTARYEAERLTAMAGADIPGLRLAVSDGAGSLVADPRAVGGSGGVLDVAGRRWDVTVRVAAARPSAVPWLVLGLGLLLTTMLLLVLAQARSREAYALSLVARRDRERDAAEAALVESEERYRLITERSSDLLARYDGEGRFLWTSASWSLLGYTGDELIGRDVFAMLHPDDLAQAHAVVGGLQPGAPEPLTWVGRFATQDGGWFWLESIVRGFGDPATGALREIQCTLRDVNRRVEAEAEEHALREIAEIVAQGPGSEIVFSEVVEQGRGLFDARAVALTRFHADARHGEVLSGVSRDGRHAGGSAVDLDGLAPAAKVFRTGRTARSEGADTPCGTCEIAVPIRVDGKLWGAIGTAFDGDAVPVLVDDRLQRFAGHVAVAIANAEAWDTLARHADTDSVTGLANRRSFYTRLHSEAERARRYGRHLSLVIFDLDHFKQVNDVHGHQAGDTVLAEVALRLSEQARDGELVARIGGEEFAWLIPESDRQGAYTAAERARRAINVTPFDGVGPLTVSAGVAGGNGAVDPDELVRYADRALYRAKDSGRNTTLVYTPEEHAEPAG